MCRAVDERRDYDEGLLVTKTLLTYISSDYIRVKRTQTSYQRVSVAAARSGQLFTDSVVKKLNATSSRVRLDSLAPLMHAAVSVFASTRRRQRFFFNKIVRAKDSA